METDQIMRVKFYGVGDLANAYQAERAVIVLKEYAAEREIRSLNDAIELYNALLFLEREVLPAWLSEFEKRELKNLERALNRKISEYFSKISAGRMDQSFHTLDLEYADDLLFLLERFNVAKTLGEKPVFGALEKASVPIWYMLADRKFVARYDRHLRDLLLKNIRNAELVIDSLLIQGPNSSYHLPRSFRSEDAATLFKAYIESETPHLNYVQVIAEARDSELGISAKLRLQAKRRITELTEILFSEEQTVKRHNIFEVGIKRRQIRSVVTRERREEDGIRYSRFFSEKALSATRNYGKILDNFARLVGYQNPLGLLEMPAFQAQRDPISWLSIEGKDFYPESNRFRVRDALTLQGTHVYVKYLREQGIEIEEVVAWFLRESLKDEFAAHNFQYSPSSPASSYLEKCRNVAVEMESIGKQFAVYCEENELDLELMRMTSKPRRWSDIPSLVDRKYLYSTSSETCKQALHLLFSDQSGLTYLNKETKRSSFERLVAEKEVSPEQLNKLQKNKVDLLFSEGLLDIVEGKFCFPHPEIILVLGDIHYKEASPYSNYGEREREAADMLVEKGWLDFSSTLLTSAEASYFNYFLNKSEHSNALDLRNTYLHGTNVDPEDEEAHELAFITLLRLLVSLVLKIRDDFMSLQGMQR